MVAISRSAATTAGSYCSFVILTTVCIFDFTAPTTRLPVNLTYGVTLIILSLINLLLGFTSQDPKECTLRAIQLCSSSLWTSIGLYHVTEYLLPRYLTETEALFGGYVAFLIIFILLVIEGLLHKSKFTAVLALGYVLSCIFEIASLWKPLRASAAAYYILLASLTLYQSVAGVLQRFRTGISYSETTKVTDKDASKEYIILGHAMNVVAFAVYAGHLTEIYWNVHREFHWVVVAGLMQCIAGIVAVRRNDAYNGSYFLLHGVFWLSSGYNLAVQHVTGVAVFPLVAVCVLLVITFLLFALAALSKEIFQVLQNLSLAVFCVALTVNGPEGMFVGSIACLSFVLSMYGLLAHISRIKPGCYRFPLGTKLFETEKIKRFFADRHRLFAICFYGKLNEGEAGTSKFSTGDMLGYSKYIDLDMVGFAVNAVSALAVLWSPTGLVVLPWVVLFGGIPQLIVGSISFSRGLTFESCAFFIFGSLWLIWGSAGGLGLFDLDHSAGAAAGCIAFIVVGILLLGLATVISVAWFVLIILFILVAVGFLLQVLAVSGIDVYQIVISIAFAVVCTYCFLSSAIKSVLGRSILPTGKPIVQVSYLHSEGDRALWADSKRASGVTNIADILNNGGICGIPTDVVYVLVAALKYPKAVERAYQTKKLAEDRPMSMWISKREQLAAGREEFGELLWDFMAEVWPSTISLVIKKGPWLSSLGVDFAEKYIGRADSIAVRMPDNTVTSHLIDQTGPVAVSSANPTGEADTTHHLQVLAKLGLKNCDGILCSGPSPENAASTVVDCRKINEGSLGFFRIGIVPKSRVEGLFETVQKRHQVLNDIPAALSPAASDDDSSDSGISDQKTSISDTVLSTIQIPDDTEGGQINKGFEDDEFCSKETKTTHLTNVIANGGITTINVVKAKKNDTLNSDSDYTSMCDSESTCIHNTTYSDHSVDIEKDSDRSSDSEKGSLNEQILHNHQNLNTKSSNNSNQTLTENCKNEIQQNVIQSEGQAFAGSDASSPSFSIKINPTYNENTDSSD